MSSSVTIQLRPVVVKKRSNSHVFRLNVQKRASTQRRNSVVAEFEVFVYVQIVEISNRYLCQSVVIKVSVI